MLNLTKVLRLISATACIAVAAGDTAHAQKASFPEKPINLIVAFPGFTENLARLVAESITDQIKQTVVVETKAGGQGIIAAQAVRAKPADGYTLFFTSNGTHAANAAMYKNLSYDPVKDFDPVAGVAVGGLMIVASSTFGPSNIAELTALAKQNPGKVSYAGTGASGQAAFELYKSLVGVDIKHVPYQSPPAATIDVVAGRVDLMAQTFQSALPLVAEGKVKPLAVSTAKRSDLKPDVPTMQEAGVPGYDMTFWNTIHVKAGTPKPIIAQLNSLVNEALKSDRVKNFLKMSGMTAFAATPEEVAAFTETETRKWKAIVDAAGMQREL